MNQDSDRRMWIAVLDTPVPPSQASRMYLFRMIQKFPIMSTIAQRATRLLARTGLTDLRLIFECRHFDFGVNASDADRSVILVAPDFQPTYTGGCDLSSLATGVFLPEWGDLRVLRTFPKAPSVVGSKTRRAGVSSSKNVGKRIPLLAWGKHKWYHDWIEIQEERVLVAAWMRSGISAMSYLAWLSASFG